MLARNLEESENQIRFDGYILRNQELLKRSCPHFLELQSQGINVEKMEILKLDSEN